MVAFTRLKKQFKDEIEKDKSLDSKYVSIFQKELDYIEYQLSSYKKLIGVNTYNDMMKRTELFYYNKRKRDGDYDIDNQYNSKIRCIDVIVID